MKCEYCDYESENQRALNGHKRIHKLENTKKIVCEKCGEEFSSNQFRKHYKTCGIRKKGRSGAKVSEWRRQQKLKAIEYKGGECIICGYNKCVRNMEFHHLDPSKKDFNISHKNCRAWEKTKKELDKTVLLCSNCHGEVEDGMLLLE